MEKFVDYTPAWDGENAVMLNGYDIETGQAFYASEEVDPVVKVLRARVARMEEVLKRGVELHENCDADTCMCGDSMWHPPAGHKPTSMLQYYGDQWAEEARRALEEEGR